MKIACLYILSVCLLMFGKHCYANDIIQQDSNGHLVAKHIGKMQAFEFANIHKDATVFTNSTPTLSEQTIINVETEDDDTGFRRKFTLLANFLIVLAGTLFLTYFFNYFKRLLYNRRQLFTVRSYKYILQGALRI